MHAAVMMMNRDNERQRAARAREWRKFRSEFMYSQNDLAHVLGCARRTIFSIEHGLTSPRFGLLRRFRILKTKEERSAA
jgi:DNA-binding XRE family transcriptional regulator